MGALHQIDSAALRSAASAWHDEFSPLPKPLLVVNIGGPTRNFFIYLVLQFFCVSFCICIKNCVLVVILFNYKIKFILG